MPDAGRLRLIGIVAAAVVVLVAAALAGFLLLEGDSDSIAVATGVGQPGEVSDIADIIEGEVAFEFDTQTGTAALRLKTSIDAVCAVAYGPGPQLGALATDTDMAGAGHSDHHPVLVGLDPGAEYYYRLQAIGPDGRSYASEVMTFRFPAAGSSAEPAAPNLALGAAVVEVSSEFSAAFAAPSAVDGDLATEWSSAGDGDEAFIVLDLGGQITVSGVGFRTREMADGTSITTAFTVTADGTTYGPFEAGPGLAIADVEFVGRTVRIDVHTSTGGNTGAVEIEVYGEG